MVPGDAETRSYSRPLAGLKGSVLIIDEVPFSRSEMSRRLKEAGAEQIVEAEDSVTALNLLRDKPDRWALVISDLEMGGLRLVRTLRTEASTPAALRNIPFIMLTDDTTLGIVSDIREAGANGVVAKPFNPDKLVAMAANVIAARRK